MSRCLRTKLLAPSQPSRVRASQNALLSLRDVPNRERHASIVLREVDTAVAEEHVDRRAPGDTVAQQPLDLRLHECAGRRPGERIRRRQRLELLDHAPIHAEVVGPGMRGRELRDAVRQPAGLKDAHGLVIEGQRARLVVDLELGFDHADAQSAPRQQIGHRGAHRPEADDEGIVVHRRCIDIPA